MPFFERPCSVMPRRELPPKGVLGCRLRLEGKVDEATTIHDVVRRLGGAAAVAFRPRSAGRQASNHRHSRFELGCLESMARSAFAALARAWLDRESHRLAHLCPDRGKKT